MKNIVLGLVLGILLASVPRAYTQQEPERIYVGTTSVRLGMEKDVVISKFAGLGYKVSKVPPSSEGPIESWVISEKNEQTGEYDVVASLSFKNARLNWALRQWAESWDAGSAKVGKNLYFLVKSFADSGNTTCSIESIPQETPEFESKESLIHCGRRTITIAVSKYKEQREETQVTETVK
jgi:hypothetical protein